MRNQIRPISLDNACGFYVVTLFNPTPIYMCEMARHRVKNGHPKDTCCKGIDLCAQNINTIIGLLINMIRRVYKRFVLSLCAYLKISRIVTLTSL